MTAIEKRIVFGEGGQPVEVIIPWGQYQEMAEALGLDLNDAAAADVAGARSDWKEGKREAFTSIEDFK